jgi:hypothetical protein
LILLLLALAAAQPPAASATALEKASASVVEEVVRQATPATTVVAVAVASPDTPELARAAQTALVSGLVGRVFKAVLLVKSGGGGAEAEARSAGADLLLRLTVRIDGTEVTLAGDLVPTWVNFWAGQDLLRRAGGSPVAARAAGDVQVLTLAHLPSSRPPDNPPHEVATRFALRALARIPERVVALAVGDLDGDGHPEIAALTAQQVLILKPTGQIVARRDLTSLARATRPSREPAGSLAIELESGKARLAAFSFARAKGELLELQGVELKVVGSIDQPALCAGPAGALWGVAVAGKNHFAPEVHLTSRSATLPFGPVAIAESPRSGTPAFAAVSPDGVASLFDAELKPTELPGSFGAAVALGDLDCDGATELIATSWTRSDDRVRVLRADGKGLTLFESEALAVNLVAAAAGDLDGDGRDEAILAGWGADNTSTLYVLGAQR